MVAVAIYSLRAMMRARAMMARIKSTITSGFAKSMSPPD
jgi:hypothetical protein